MDFAPLPPRRAPPENIVPMINVVFLLLIFFLMSAQITTQPPVEITPPQSRADTPPDGTRAVFLSADGTFYFGAAIGEAALAAAAAADLDTLRVEADREADAQVLARALTRLRSAGVARIELMTGGL